MRPSNTKGLLAISLATALLAGCAEPPHRTVPVAPSGEVVVQENPPQLKPERPGPAPKPAWLWQSGNWTYSNARWVWLPGHWQSPPLPNSRWVSGHWEHNERGWVWNPGYWE